MIGYVGQSRNAETKSQMINHRQSVASNGVAKQCRNIKDKIYTSLKMGYLAFK